MAKIIDFKTREVTQEADYTLRDAMDAIEYLEQQLEKEVNRNAALYTIGVTLLKRLRKYEEVGDDIIIIP